MPANLPPHYHEAEKRYRQARSIPAKVAALQDMMSATPKHKGTDHLRADLRARMARHMEELEKPRSVGSGQPEPFALRKEGAGQAILIGLPNSGKSQLLAALTGAAAKVASYPLTTQLPLPGVLKLDNVQVQLIDTPAINYGDMQTRLFSLLRNTDLLLIVVDLSADAVEQAEEVFSELEKWGYLLLGRDEETDPEEPRVQKRAVLVANKADSEGADDEFQGLAKRYSDRLPVLKVDSEHGAGLDALKGAIFTALGRVRVYTKAPSGEPDYASPIVLPEGSKVEDAALSLHKEWKRRLKYALLWGSGKFGGQRVGRDYVLADGDVLEFHG